MPKKWELNFLEMAQPQIEGQQFLTADFWLDVIPTENKPIQYLEIGVHSGANILSVARLHASHPDSRMWCIDPWIDYAEYPEYKDKQGIIYSHFCCNMKNFDLTHKIVPIRGFSNKEIPELEDNYFDMIYIDGNHEPEFVLEDAVLSFRKLKIGGYLIFDDYGFDGPNGTSKGIDGFLSGYHKRIEILKKKWTSWDLAQVFLRKLS